MLPLNPLYRFALLAGLSAHLLYFARGHPWLNPRGVILFHLTVYLILSIFVGCSAALAASASYLTALFSSITIYRLFLHRTRRFPGPFLGKVSKTFMGPWLHRKYQSHFEFAELQRRYGDFVRVGPCEIVIFDVDAVQAVYGLHSKCTKKNTAFYDHFTYKGIPNLDSICDDAKHRQRRKICEKAFTMKTIESLVPSTRTVIRTWLAKIDSTLGSPLNTSLYANLISFDNMGRIGYSKDFGTIDAGIPDRILTVIGSIFTLLTSVGLVGWIFALSAQLPSIGSVKEFERLGEEMTAERLQNDSANTHDMMKFFIEDFKAGVPKAYTNYNTLVADSQGLLVAATDTISSSLACTFYFIAKYRDVRDRLLYEIKPAFDKTVPGEFTNADLGTIHYLDAVINETLRLMPTVPIAGPRITPPEGIVVNGVLVPGLTTVVTAPWCTQRDERYFKDAQSFIPERWTTRPELVLDRRAFYPFQVGRYDCLGKRMAYMILRMTIAYTLWHYDFGFAPGEDGTAFIENSQTHVMLRTGALKCVFRRRQEQCEGNAF